MAHNRYYLVRRDNREFIGPMMVDEFKRRLERMEFGMQDEVASHCGPWIVLDNREEISKYYAELTTAVGESLPMSWREVTGHARVISRQDTRKDRKKESRSSKSFAHSREGFNEFLKHRQRKSQRIKMGAVAVIFVGAVLAGFIVTRKEDVPQVNELASLASKADPTEFLNTMGVKIIPTVGRIVRSQKSQAAWLPLLRMYAFYTTGSIEGVPSKLLRGDVSPMAPQDCSVESWKLRWREGSSQVVQFVQGKTLNKNPWTKILAMDPNWIRRRPAKGWMKPRNFYEGCLMTAQMAIRSIASDPSPGADLQDGATVEALTMIGRRLQQQLDIVTNGRVITPFDKNYSLGAMSCLESYASPTELDTCRGPITDGPLKPLMDEKMTMGILRAAVNQGQGVLDPKLSLLIQNVLPKVTNEDVMSRFDVSPEIKLLNYLASGLTVDVAFSKTDQEYPDIKFR